MGRICMHSHPCKYTHIIIVVIFIIIIIIIVIIIIITNCLQKQSVKVADSYCKAARCFSSYCCLKVNHQSLSTLLGQNILLVALAKRNTNTNINTKPNSKSHSSIIVGCLVKICSWLHLQKKILWQSVHSLRGLQINHRNYKTIEGLHRSTNVAQTSHSSISFQTCFGLHFHLRVVSGKTRNMKDTSHHLSAFCSFYKSTAAHWAFSQNYTDMVVSTNCRRIL